MKIRCAIVSLIAMGAMVFAQDMSAPLSDDALFGGEKDIVTVIDTATASAGTVQLVADEKKYPIFLLEGDVSSGITGKYQFAGITGGVSAGTGSLLGAVQLSGLSGTVMPDESTQFGAKIDATISPAGATGVESSAFADLRLSEYKRFHASGSFAYATQTVTDPIFYLDEIFVDASIGRKLFFRLGKQRIRWGVGTWFQPSDVLSLAAIDPDDPDAEREGPFAFKTDYPFGLNHATLYLVPPVSGEPSQFAGAARADVVAGGWEISLAAFARSDIETARPRGMLMFSGALGAFDLYGEGVAAYGADRLFVRASGSSFETFRKRAEAIFQATLGAKYSWSDRNGLSLNLHGQGYYNGTGYADPSILRSAAALLKLRADPGYAAADLQQRGLWYAAGSASLSYEFGEGKSSGEAALAGTAVADISDGSMRVSPSISLALGDRGSSLDLSIGAPMTFGAALSEYAPNGNTVKPTLSATIMDTVSLAVSAPIVFNEDGSVKSARADYSVYVTALSF